MTMQVKQEIQTQLERFIDKVGSLPTHIDGHQHIHVIPQVCDVLSALMKNYGINWTRIPVESNLEKCDLLDERQKSFFKSVEKDALIAKETFSRYGIRFTGHFIGLSTMGKYMVFQRLQQAFENVFTQNNLTGSKPCSSCELMVHPGYKSIIGCGGCGEGPDLFACSEEREHELTTLTSPQLKEYLRSSNIRLCSFKDL